MSYNVQLLFDGTSDPGDFEDYDPERSDWNEEDYFKRLSMIARSIMEYRNTGPDIVVLQEVENPDCLRDLVDFFLFDCGYLDAAFFSSPRDPFGHGLISKYPISAQSQHFAWNETMEGRVIGEVTINVAGNKFYLFLNHWKSLRNGEEEARLRHQQEGRLLENLISRIKSDDPSANILVIGDLNDSLENLPLNAISRSNFPANSSSTALYYDRPSLLANEENAPPTSLAVKDPGTYYYQKNWNQLDHIFFSNGVLERFETDTKILWNSLVLREDGTPRDYIRRYKRGLSDHLPIVLELN